MGNNNSNNKTNDSQNDNDDTSPTIDDYISDSSNSDSLIPIEEPSTGNDWQSLIDKEQQIIDDINDEEKKNYLSQFTEPYVNLTNPPKYTIDSTKNYLYTLNDYLISQIILLTPIDIYALHDTSKRLQNIIDNHLICSSLLKYGLTDKLYVCAVQSNCFDFVKYVYNQQCYYFDCPDNQKWHSKPVLRNSIESIATSKSDLCCVAYQNKNMKIFNFLQKHKFPLSTRFGEHVSLVGDIDMLKLYCEKNHPTSTMFMNAVTNNHLDCLEILFGCNNYEFNFQNSCTIAVSKGHIDCLKYLTVQNVDGLKKCDELMCFEAIRKKQFECLKYLLENGCKFNFNTIVSSCRNNEEMMQYLRDNEVMLKEKSFKHRFFVNRRYGLFENTQYNTDNQFYTTSLLSGKHKNGDWKVAFDE